MNNSSKWLYAAQRFIALSLAMSAFCVSSFAQQPQNPPPPPPGIQQQQKEAAKPERKITDAEAAELFKSFDDILKFSSEDTGLPIKGPVKHKIVSRDEVEKYMLERMKDDPDAKRLEASEVSLKRFGLIPKDMKLREFLVALLKEQIAGFYDSKTKVMYLLDWVSPESQKPVLAHELTHALQDQNYDLEKWGDVTDAKLTGYDEMVRDEQRAARQAVVEGQATVVLLDYLLSQTGMNISVATLNPAQYRALKSQMTNGGTTPLYNQAPLFLKQALLFPYDSGLDFEHALLGAGGKLQTYAGVFRNPPVDTRQILEPKTYIDQQHVSLPQLAPLPELLAKEYDKFDDGAFGEFDLQILVKQWKPSLPASLTATAADQSPTASPDDPDLPLIQAWRGGYYMSFYKKNDKSKRVYIAFLMRLATAADARKFESVYRAGLKQRYKSLNMKSPALIETEEGPLTIGTDAEWFIATESFDQATAAKVRESMLTKAKQTSSSSSNAASLR